MIEKKERGLMAFIVKHPIWSFATLVVIAIIVFSIYACFLPTIMGFMGEWGTGSGDKGLFGDSFGALTSLFSILAMMAVFLTFLYQKRQLDLQREEINDNKEINKYQQIPLFSIEEPKVVLCIPELSNSSSIESKIGIRFLLRLANDALVKKANIRIKVKCGRHLSSEEVVNSFDIVGFGGDMKRLHYYQFSITNGAYVHLANNIRWANMMGEDNPLLVQVSISYFSMLGLHISMKREYVLRPITRNEEMNANIAQQWGCALNTPPNLRGNYDEDVFTCRNHFRGGECSNVDFWLTENDDGSSFDVIE